MKKTLYLHIGFPKTGTTSIQKFLYINKELFINKDFYYPKLDNIEGMPNGRYLLMDNKYNDTSFDNFKEIWERYYKQIQDSKCSNIIISEEGLCTLQDIKYWNIIKLNELFNVKVICYYRRSVDFLTTTYAQNTPSHNWQNKLPLNEFINGGCDYFDYSIENLYNYAEIFGKENIILRPYDRNQWKNENIIDDFMSILGVNDLTEFKEIEEISNPSYNRNDVDVCRRLNKVNLNHLCRFALTDNYEPKIIDTLSDKDIKEVVDKYYPLECKLAKYFLNKDELFINKYPDIYGKKRPSYEDVSETKFLKILSDYKKTKYLRKLKSIRRWVIQIKLKKNEKKVRILGIYLIRK